MNKTLAETQLVDLLPRSIARDKRVHDAAKSAQPELDAITAAVPIIELYAHIDTLPEPVLRAIAWENQIDTAEWNLALTIEDKRALVKDSFELNKRRGTLWSVYRVFELLRFNAVIEEWWEPGVNGEPGTFRIAVLDAAGRGQLTATEYNLIDRLIYKYKPLSRHNLGINIEATGNTQAFIGTAVTTHAVLDVGIPTVKLETTITAFAGVGSLNTGNVTVLPDGYTVGVLDGGIWNDSGIWDDGMTWDDG